MGRSDDWTAWELYTPDELDPLMTVPRGVSNVPFSIIELLETLEERNPDRITHVLMIRRRYPRAGD